MFLTELPSFVIGKCLQDQSILQDHTQEEWPTFFNYSPPTTEKAQSVSLYDITPTPDGRIQRTGEVILHHGVQIAIRAEEQSVGFKKAYDVASYLSSIHYQQVIIQGCTYLIQSVTISSILPLGVQEENGLYMFTVNLRATISQA